MFQNGVHPPPSGKTTGMVRQPHKETHMNKELAKVLRSVAEAGKSQNGTQTVALADITQRAPEERVFLEQLSEGVCVTEACERAGMARRTAYRRRIEDRDFRELWDESLRMAADLLEAEADRRGRTGWSEDIYHKGRVIGTRHRYSDRMLMFRLRALKPAMYRNVH
jgi:hypothetical protein